MNSWQMKYEAPSIWERTFTPKPVNKDDKPRLQQSIHPRGRARSAPERNARVGQAILRMTGRAGEFQAHNFK